jgi:hypothetical protein
MKDCVAIEAFVAYLRDSGYPDLCIDQRPDKENRQSKDIDAIAGPFAIEHTSISTFQNQQTQNDWFKKAMAKLASELPAPPYELVIYSDEYYPVKIGQDWSAIKNALKTWIAQESPKLADGEYDFNSLPGIPFALRVEKSSNGTHGIFFIRRHPEKNDSLPARIDEHLTTKEKIQKLLPYKKDGFITILLIEGNLSRNKMLHAFRLAFPDGLHPDLDEIWYVSTWGNHTGKFAKLSKWGGTKNDD